MAKRKTVSRGMLDGEGSTVTEAKADLAARIDAALTGSYNPVVLTYGRLAAIVYREPQGWSYATMGADLIGIGITKSQPTCTHFVGDKDECIQRAGYHIVQCGCNVEKTRSVDDLPDWLSLENRADLVRWCRWQRAARHAKQTLPGADAGQIHSWACDHERDAMFA